MVVMVFSMLYVHDALIVHEINEIFDTNVSTMMMMMNAVVVVVVVVMMLDGRCYCLTTRMSSLSS